ncbi:patched domain-containing protein 3-like isoform X2 [Anneissia japonica]|uniref:patched domain-containing protein 3-like isoform X2 n=1 Tax=Anneissia japonica TaxID=1529436 RepID=UPI001425620A|nr:patched domain-containing protein 3-like isoform X2 [Anneissia japonica]
MKRPRLDFIEEGLTKLYAKYGRIIARCPLPFLIIPVLTAIGLGYGLKYLKTVSSVEYLYTPLDGQGKIDRDTVESFFTSEDVDAASVTRLSRTILYSWAIITTKDINGNTLSTDIFRDILNLDEQLKNITIVSNDTVYGWNDVCLAVNGECLPLLVLAAFRDDVDNLDNLQITYPVYTDGTTGNQYFLGTDVGGVTLKSGSDVLLERAFAVKLNYYLSIDRSVRQATNLWSSAFLNFLLNYESDLIDVRVYTTRSLDTELSKVVDQIVPIFAVGGSLLIAYAILSSNKRDWVQNKPFLCLSGVISALLAILSSFGLLSYCGFEFTEVVACLPVLILSIGVDDMFIMLAAWRNTDIRQSVEDRMSRAFSEAALSITITSITDGIAFAVGAFSRFPSVRIFCTYAAAAVTADFIFQITFFAAALALFGYRESSNRHCLTCFKVKPNDEAPNLAYRVMCAGGPSQSTTTTSEIAPSSLMRFFKSVFGPIVLHNVSKVIILISYGVYLGFGIWGVLNVDEGLALTSLAADDSYVNDFYEYEYRYFREYGPSIMLTITETVDYSDVSAQESIENLVSDYEALNVIHTSTFTESWLRFYLQYLAAANITYSSNEEFVAILRQQFLQLNAYAHYAQDIVFADDTSTDIIASRFILISKDISSTYREQELLVQTRDLLDSSPYETLVYNALYVFFDQYTAILPATLQNLGIALAAMLIVSILLIPSLSCSIWVVAAIASIEVGVIGYMTFWGVRLDSISMIVIILCIGFSVDFSAHITYSYTIAPGKTKKMRMNNALFLLGMPMLQGAVSTILGVLTLAFSSYYIFRTLFKTLFLVIVFGLYHGLFVLPVLLSLFGPTSSKSIRKDKTTRKSVRGMSFNSHGTRRALKKRDTLMAKQKADDNYEVSVADGVDEMNTGSEQTCPVKRDPIVEFNNKTIVFK